MLLLKTGDSDLLDPEQLWLLEKSFVELTSAEQRQQGTKVSLPNRNTVSADLNGDAVNKDQIRMAISRRCVNPEIAGARHRVMELVALLTNIFRRSRRYGI